MYERKMDEMISHFNRKVANMDIDQKYKMELLGIITAIGIATEKESAEPEPHWIPCSERLPELNQICIVTDETRRCAYEYGLHGETYDEENGWTYLGHRIVAWMPLPEPYKEREDE